MEGEEREKVRRRGRKSEGRSNVKEMKGRKVGEGWRN